MRRTKLNLQNVLGANFRTLAILALALLASFPAGAERSKKVRKRLDRRKKLLTRWWQPPRAATKGLCSDSWVGRERNHFYRRPRRGRGQPHEFRQDI